MKTILISTLLTLLLQCNGDVSENQQQLTRIQFPTQSLQPPTFENPIKDYTVGLVPPPIDGQSPRDDRRPRVQQQLQQVQTRNHIHSNPTTRTRPSGFINTARPFANSVQQPSGYSAVHQKTHHSSNNLLQPQVYQPKTAIYQPNQQFTAHHRAHSARPVTQRRVHQHSTHTHYGSILVQRAAAGVQYAYPSVPKSAFAPRLVSSAGTSIIQSYPSVSYTPIGQYGSTLNFGNAILDPELVQIISEVYGQTH